MSLVAFSLTGGTTAEKSWMSWSGWVSPSPSWPLHVAAWPFLQYEVLRLVGPFALAGFLEKQNCQASFEVRSGVGIMSLLSHCQVLRAQTSQDGMVSMSLPNERRSAVQFLPHTLSSHQVLVVAFA